MSFEDDPALPATRDSRFERVGQALAWGLSSPVVWATVFIVFGTISLVVGREEAGFGIFAGGLICRFFFRLWKTEERG